MKNINKSNAMELVGKEFEYDENYNISDFDFKKYKLIKHYKFNSSVYKQNFNFHTVLFSF